MKRLIIFLAIPLLFTACEIFESYDKRTYYDVTGVGYVYYYETKEPASNVQVFVSSIFRSNGYATVPPIKEYFTSDNTGYFCVRFLKRTERENVVEITVYAYDENINRFSELISCAVDELYKLKIDTLWIR